eukprot:2314465-Lingulodinium_polyedra.AAC.1
MVPRVVDGFAICGAVKHATARLKPFLSSSRAIGAQKCVQTGVSVLRRRVCRNLRVSWVDRHM